jgi:hypothetical protein
MKMGEAKRRAQAQFEAQKPEQRLGDAPIEPEHHEAMTALARVINEGFNGDAPPGKRKVGFVLMVFPFDDFDGRCNYISNGADRRDIVTLMKEMVARFEGQPETSGRA